MDQRDLAEFAAGQAMGAGLLGGGGWPLSVDVRLLGRCGSRRGHLPAETSAQRGNRAEYRGPLARRELAAGQLGVARRPLRLAGRLLGACPGKLDLGSKLLPLDAPRLCLCRWLLGLYGGAARRVVRAGSFRPECLFAAGLLLHADHGDQPFRLFEPSVPETELRTLLFRRLLRFKLP